VISQHDRDEAAFDDLLESANAILEYAGKDKARFLRDRLVQDAVIRRFEVVGEATKRLSSTFRTRHPEVPWKQIAGFRDVLIHHYEAIVAEEVWSVITLGLPELVDQLGRVRTAESP
jgi:uncharacterized protein with HEPN domain